MSLGTYYLLEGREVIPTDDIYAWSMMFEEDRRTVAKTNIGRASIWTVFLGIDHAFGAGPPQLFETVIYGGVHNGRAWRCATYDQAEEQHSLAVALADG